VCRADAGSRSAWRRKKISLWKSFRAAETRTRLSQLISSEQDDSASGFAWVAREPKLMCGAKGARILTEIKRIAQWIQLAPLKKRPKKRFARATIVQIFAFRLIQLLYN
jgi:hypothetical protein